MRTCENELVLVRTNNVGEIALALSRLNSGRGLRRAARGRGGRILIRWVIYSGRLCRLQTGERKRNLIFFAMTPFARKRHDYDIIILFGLSLFYQRKEVWKQEAISPLESASDKPKTKRKGNCTNCTNFSTCWSEVWTSFGFFLDISRSGLAVYTHVM